MIEYPQRRNRQYRKPSKEVLESVPDGLEIRCSACKVDLLGVFKDNELHIKHRKRNVFMRQGVCKILCTSCSFENVINLREIKVNLHVQDEETQLVKITPKALELAEEEGVGIRNVVGSGKDGQITIADIREFLSRKE